MAPNGSQKSHRFHFLQCSHRANINAVRVISKGGLLGLLKKGFPQEAKDKALDWLRFAEHANWQCFEDVKNDLSKTDCVDGSLVFNICGNSYRLIANPVFKTGRLYVKYFMTHSDYDKGKWKNK